MLAYLEKIPIGQSTAFYVKELSMAQFDAPLHFHPEYEIMMVLKSRGNRFVGDNISDYREGDLVFLGPNLPHYWRKGTSAAYGADPVNAIVIQFGDHLVSPSLLDKIEFSAIKNLFERSAYGVQFFEDTFEKVAEKIRNVLKTNDFYKIIHLFEVLNILATANNYQTLSSPGYKPNLNQQDNDRIDKIYRYILDNYPEDIELETAASLINMNKSAFCHFFKKRTRKNFGRFVNEVRVGHASKMLIETSKNISEICYECGFRNLSNFNRRFKEIKKMSPMAYRRMFDNREIAPRENFLR